MSTAEASSSASGTTTKKVNKCHHYCSVPGCKTSQYKEHKMSFHTFPKEGESNVIIDDLGCDEVVDRREAWCRRTFLGKSYGREITGATYVCSRHFQLSDFCSQEKTKKRCRRLKKTAVPSLNLPSPEILSSSNSDKQKMLHLKFRSPFPVAETSSSTTSTITLGTSTSTSTSSSINTIDETIEISQDIDMSHTEDIQLEQDVFDPLTPRRPDQGARSLLEMFEDGNQSPWDYGSVIISSDHSL